MAPRRRNPRESGDPVFCSALSSIGSPPSRGFRPSVRQGRFLLQTILQTPGERGRSAVRGIVRAFPRDGYVMRVAFAQARIGDLDELRLAVEFLDGGRAGIAHRSAKAAD